MSRHEHSGVFRIRSVTVECPHCGAENHSQVFTDTNVSSVECVCCDETIEIDFSEKCSEPEYDEESMDL